MPLFNPPSVTVAQISNATAFGRAVLLYDASEVPDPTFIGVDSAAFHAFDVNTFVTQISITSAQISDATTAGRHFIQLTNPSGSAVPVLSSAGDITLIEGATGTPLTAQDGVVNSAA